MSISSVMLGCSLPFNLNARMLTVAVEVVGNKLAASAKVPVSASLGLTASTNVIHLAHVLVRLGMFALLIASERWLASLMSISSNVYRLELYVPKSCRAEFACVCDNAECSWKQFANKLTFSSHGAQLLRIHWTLTLWMVFLIWVVSVYSASLGTIMDVVFQSFFPKTGLC